MIEVSDDLAEDFVKDQTNIDVKNWVKVKSTPTVKKARGPIEQKVEIETREGTVVAEPGDYIIKEKDGNEYPISAEKFKEYYQVIEE